MLFRQNNIVYFLGNTLVCVAIWTDRHLQNTTNYFLFSLAIADLFVCIFVIPLSLIIETQNGAFLSFYFDINLQLYAYTNMLTLNCWSFRHVDLELFVVPFVSFSSWFLLEISSNLSRTHYNFQMYFYFACWKVEITTHTSWKPHLFVKLQILLFGCFLLQVRNTSTKHDFKIGINLQNIFLQENLVPLVFFCLIDKNEKT